MVLLRYLLSPYNLQWMFLWELARQTDSIEGLRIVLKASLKSVSLAQLSPQHARAILHHTDLAM